MTPQEDRRHIHRPPVRRLAALDNDELQALFVIRAERIAVALKGHQFWENNRIVYWNQFLALQANLYEVMLEIQSRYPAAEIKGYELLLPLPNTELWCREKFGLEFGTCFAAPIHEGNVVTRSERPTTTARRNRHDLPGH